MSCARRDLQTSGHYRSERPLTTSSLPSASHVTPTPSHDRSIGEPATPDNVPVMTTFVAHGDTMRLTTSVAKFSSKLRKSSRSRTYAVSSLPVAGPPISWFRRYHCENDFTIIIGSKQRTLPTIHRAHSQYNCEFPALKYLYYLFIADWVPIAIIRRACTSKQQGVNEVARVAPPTIVTGIDKVDPLVYEMRAHASHTSLSY